MSSAVPGKETFEFDSITDMLLVELNVGGRESVGVGKHTTRFFTNGNFIGIASRLFKRICDAEMEKVTMSQVLECGLINFRSELFEKHEILNDIECERRKHAPILTGVVQTIARVEPDRKDSSNTETELHDIQDGKLQKKTSKALCNRHFISIVSIQMIAYMCKKSCNVMLSAVRLQETLLKRVQLERFLISYVHINFYDNTIV
ncbi:hypothetical protein K440DRAFT_638525 [Wilcoxina mikolae CBS 423.85]|nr:hypothetical protein K440DRAFT_638525 [Wilcoxina mikolae CBS 423.85]